MFQLVPYDKVQNQFITGLLKPVYKTLCKSSIPPGDGALYIYIAYSHRVQLTGGRCREVNMSLLLMEPEAMGNLVEGTSVGNDTHCQTSICIHTHTHTHKQTSTHIHTHANMYTQSNTHTKRNHC